jgi:uncharacterized membrane protein
MNDLPDVTDLPEVIDLLAVATAVGSAAVGGVYLAFSVMVLPAFRRLPAKDATAAMREINLRAERGAFIAFFSVTLLLSIALGATVIGQLSSSTGVLYLVGGILSLASAVVTVVANVPLNNKLERDGVSFWPQYEKRWGRLNSFRASLALGAVGVVASAAGV